MTEHDLPQQLQFINEADRLKRIQRMNVISDGSRRENSAEHSWHLAVMATVLWDHAPPGADRSRVLEMALLHDLVEIDAGDTFAYGPTAPRTKLARESEAADRLFGLLPSPQCQRLRGLWTELEQGQTAEARFVRVLDRLQPLLLHRATEGRVWRAHQVTRAQVLERVAEIREATPGLWPLVESILDWAVAKGALRDS